MSKVHPIEDLFGELVELETPEERKEYLDRVCGDDEALRGQLQKLLAAHEGAGSFLGSEGVTETTDVVRSDLSGTSIGPYKLREQIGEGGMGTVYVAEQQKPLKRKVALKVIKPGMDSKSVIARFEAERQALAIMDHPNIAKVLDAGTTDQGRPYFVMELVSGIQITDYCDEHKLTIHERLELFGLVCQAIQHAHQKGIIHRDVKPSNVLVTELDGKPVPKIIDFGVAKALNQTLTEHSIYTSFQAVIGTPLYMSPEQATLSAVDVDTRSDVYSLGVLLYELLTGTTPFDLQELKQIAQDEVLRYVREQEPPRPSNRLSTLGDTVTRVSQARQTQPEQLGRLVKGDLDWIVMKALEKERSRRYKTADGFASDIRRHLSNEPVEARPPSKGYLIGRFYRRNKAAVLGSLSVILLLVIAVVGTTSGWRMAVIERQSAKDAHAKAKSVLSQLTDQLRTRTTEYAMAGRKQEARDTLLALLQVDSRGESWRAFIEGHLNFYDGNVTEAIKKFRQACDADPEFIAARMMLATAYVFSGDGDRYIAEREEVRKLVPQGPLDELHAIQATMYGRQVSASALKRLNKYLAEHHYTPIARLIRAEVLVHQAIYNQSPEYIRMATLDSDVAVEEMPGNTMALFISLFAHTQAARLYRKLDKADDFSRHVERGKQRAQQLADSDWSAAHVFRAEFYAVCFPDDDGQHEAWKTATRHGLKGFLREQYLLYLLENDRHRDFTRSGGSKHDSAPTLAESLLAAHIPEQRRAMISEIKKNLIKPGEKIDFYIAGVLSLLGEDVSTYTQGFGFKLRATVASDSAPFLDQYFQGKIDENRLLDECQHAKVSDLGFVGLCAAMKQIGMKNVDAAIPLLAIGIEEPRDPWSAMVARALRARLRDNPNWPFADR